MIRSHRRRLVAGIALVATGLALAAALAGAAGARSSADQLGPPPLDPTQTWLGTFTLNDHVFRTGDRVVATAKVTAEECFVKGQCVGQVSWSGLPFASKKPCPGSAAGSVPKGTPTLRCTGRAGAPTGGWMTAVVNFSNPTGSAATRSTYYVVLPKDQAVIEGHVENRDGGGVGGVEMRAYRGSKLEKSAVTGADGYFMMRVKPGSFQVVPRGGPRGKRKPVYKPAYRNVSVAKGKTAHAGFVLQGGLEVSISFASASTPADGRHVVTGKVTVREYGKPKPKAGVQLEAMSTLTPRKAIYDAPRVTVCSGPGARIWPTGTLSAPVGSPIDVVTDDNGVYNFTLTIGTVPGAWMLRAWGRNSLGGLSLEDADGADEATIRLAPVGTATTAQFLGILNALGNTGALPNAGSHTGLRDDLLKADRSLTGGLTFQEAGFNGGGALIISEATKPPEVDERGLIDAPGGLVMAYPSWTGAGLGTALPDTSLGGVIQKGGVPDIPTYAEWTSGGEVKAWSSALGSRLNAAWSDFVGFGWAYRGVEGGCS